MRKLTLFILCFVINIGVISAQTKVTGVVISSEDGLPVIGASVIVKGSKVGTATDMDGRFTLTVPSGGKLLMISYIGFDPKEVIVKSSLKVVLLPSSKALEEVVVTAFGIKKERKALGYAAQDIKGDALQKAGNTDLSSALSGKLTGVTVTPSSGMPGASSQIMIRGARSFSGDNTPLYVIDGMPVASSADFSNGKGAQGAISVGDGVTGTDVSNRAVDIDPNDIESITILEGQSAAALYGIRASNGVIQITTKSGKGLKKGKPQISFSTNNSFSVIARYPELQTTYAQGSGGLYKPTSSTSWGPKITDLPKDPVYGGETDNSYTQTYGLHPGMYYVPQLANAGLDPWTTPQVYDNVKSFFQTGYTTNNTINLSQSLDRANYSFSIAEMNQTGIIPTTGMDRYSVKGNTEWQISDSWKTGFSANYIQSTIDKTTSANDGIVATVYPSPASYNLKGIPSYYNNNPYKQNAYRSTAGFDDAYWSLDNNTFTEQTNRFFGNTYINYTDQPGLFSGDKLDAKLQLGVDTYSTLYETIWGYGHQNGLGSAEDQTYKKTILNSLLTANYTFKPIEFWDFGLLLGNEINDERVKYLDAYGQTYNFPGWNDINNTITKSNFISQLGNRTVGFFGSASATWKNMLYLNGTLRNDYVSTMPSRHRSFVYPSLSVGFILTELESLHGNPIISYAKLRASYAQVGQSGIYTPNYYSVPSYGGGYWGGYPIVYPISNVNAFSAAKTIYDPELKPQNTNSYEGGFDLKLFNNIIGLNYTFSRQNVTDQIFSVPLSGSTGSEYLMTNGGAIHTNTHEITLLLNPVKNKTVDWNMVFNWTKTDNYVDKLAPGVGSIFLGGFETPQVRAQIGEKFPVIYGSSYARDANGHLLIGSDGLPMAGEMKVIGRVSPDFILGFSNTLTVFGTTLNAVFSWKKGGQMYGGTNGLLGYYGRSKATENRNNKIVDGYHEDGTKNTTAVSLQSYYNTINNIDEASIYNNSFLKLREISLSRDIVNKPYMKLAATVFARNILIWSNYPNFDPESTQGNTNMAGGFERFSLPQTTNYGLGLNFKF
jgi:TonB-linked outer membrane protein, SusC/RagA family